MCRAHVSEEARDALAELLADICAALCPDDSESVRVGPVDFGPELANAPETTHG